MNEAKKDKDFFSTGHLVDDLGGRSVRGGMITVASQVTRIGLTLGGTYVLAHRLPPEDFGLMGMVTAVTGFIIVFKDLGLSMATLQRAEITHEQVSTLFWINLAIGTLMMLLTAALGPALSWFYREPRLTAITMSLAACFAFGGLTVQHQALLRRQMRFAALAAIEISARLAGVAVAIGLAVLGRGYWALVAMLITFEVVTTAGCWLLCRWRPGKPVRRAGVRALLGFGGNITGFNFVNYLYRNLDKILIGKVAGSYSLGLYSNASELVVKPIQSMVAPITAVVIPTLSRLQNDLPTFRRYYLRAVYLIALVTMPVLLFLLFFSRSIILFVLGNQWLAAVPIFRLFSLAAVFQPIAITSSWLFISLGRTREMFRWRLITVWLSVSLYVTGVFYRGAVGVAWGYAVSSLLLLVPTLWYAQRRTAIGTSRIFLVTLRPLTAALAANTAALLIYRQISANLFLALAVMLVSYPLLTCLLARSFEPVREIWQLGRRHLKTRGQTTSPKESSEI